MNNGEQSDPVHNDDNQYGGNPYYNPPPGSPIIIDLGAQGYLLTGANSPVWFDIRADGVPLHIGWTDPAAEVAFLWLDRNANGYVDNGAEFFGNATPLASGGVASNGFEALAEFDANHDGVIDAADPVWGRLQLWVDRNHDGIAQPGELFPVASSNIVGIYLNYQVSNRRDEFGNLFRYRGNAAVRDDRGRVERQPIYDVCFVFVWH